MWNFLLLIATSAWGQNSKVFEITQENIKETLGKNKHVFLEFFSPECESCQQFFQVWEDIWTHFSDPDSEGFDPQISVAKMNILAQKNLKQEFQVSLVPTLVMIPKFTDKVFERFEGNNEKVPILEWIDKSIKEWEHKDHNIEEEDTFYQYEVVVQDKDNSKIWRGQFEDLKIQIGDTKKELADSLQDVLIGVKQNTDIQKEEFKELKNKNGDTKKELSNNIQVILTSFKEYERSMSELKKNMKSIQSKIDNQNVLLRKSQQISEENNSGWISIIFIFTAFTGGFFLAKLLQKKSKHSIL